MSTEMEKYVEEWKRFDPKLEDEKGFQKFIEKKIEAKAKVKEITLCKFSAEFNDAILFKKLLKAMANLTIDDATFHVSFDGIHFRQMEPSHVAMLEIMLPKHAFDAWVVNQEGSFTISLAQTLSHVLKRLSKDEKIELHTHEDRLALNLKHTYTREYSVPFLDYLTDPVPKPKITLNVEAVLIAKDFRQIIEDCPSSHITLEATLETLTFKGVADDKETGYKVALRKLSDSLLKLNLKTREVVRANFSTGCLQEFAKYTTPITDLLNVQFSTDGPIQIKAQMPNDIQYVYWLAPRITVED